MADPEDPKDEASEDEKIPALFATIHFRSDARPDGYTDEDIRRINEGLNPVESSRPTEDKDR